MTRFTRWTVLALAFLCLLPAGAGGAGGLQLPDLAAVPPFDVRIERPDVGTDPEIEWVLRFTTSIANRGAYPMDLIGRPEDVLGQKSSAHQCVAWIENRVCTDRREVGRFVWHPAHAHFHVEDFALYELRLLTPQGDPDLSDAGLVATSGKVSFCLQDTRWDSDDPPPFPNQFANPIYLTCYPFQGIDPLWRDEYDWHLPGQQLTLEGVSDGDYALLLTVNPESRLLETDPDNNVASVKLRLSNGGTQVIEIP